MNKNELIAEIANETGLARQDVTKTVDVMFDLIARSLKAGQEVRIVGFGNFTFLSRPASKGRNPRTGEEVDVPAGKQPKFRAAKGFKDAIQ
jgi:DNA-binding protein HU-beta